MNVTCLEDPPTLLRLKLLMKTVRIVGRNGWRATLGGVSKGLQETTHTGLAMAPADRQQVPKPEPTHISGAGADLEPLDRVRRCWPRSIRDLPTSAPPRPVNSLRLEPQRLPPHGVRSEPALPGVSSSSPVSPFCRKAEHAGKALIWRHDRESLDGPAGRWM